MNKLIELLNEYENYLDTTNRDDIQVHFRHINWADVKCFHNYSLIISKRYGFIKRLVDNDKIDFNFVERIGSGDFIYDMNSPYYYSCTCEDLKEYNEVDRVLMQLAIQDEPIEFLISILK